MSGIGFKSPPGRPGLPGALALVVVVAVVLAGCADTTPADGEQKGTLSVSSEPSGALVFLDGRDTGERTPATFEVSAGSHTVLLTMDGRQDWGPRSFTVTAGETTRVSATLSPVPPGPEPDPRSLGAEPLPDDIYEKLPVLVAGPIAASGVLQAASSSNLPTAVDLSQHFPVPRSQGDQGSCVGWAVAFALKSYHERIERRWRLDTDRHLMSPAYVYNQIKLPQGGAYIPDAIDLLAYDGVSSWALMPYDDEDDFTQPTRAAREEARNYQIATWGKVRGGSAEDFRRQMKAHLAAGRPIVVVIPVFSDFDYLNEENPIYDQMEGVKLGSHAVVVVGYSDRKDAFLIINSWGSNWGIPRPLIAQQHDPPKGYGWIHYDLFGRQIRRAYVTYDIVGSGGTRPDSPSRPVPADASTGVRLDTTLAWTKGDHTSSFDVYLGTERELSILAFKGTRGCDGVQAGDPGAGHGILLAR